MKRLKSLKSSWNNVIMGSLIFGIAGIILLAHVLFIICMATASNETYEIIEKVLDEEPNPSIRGGY